MFQCGMLYIICTIHCIAVPLAKNVLLASTVQGIGWVRFGLDGSYIRNRYSPRSLGMMKDCIWIYT